MCAEFSETGNYSIGYYSVGWYYCSGVLAKQTEKERCPGYGGRFLRQGSKSGRCAQPARRGQLCKGNRFPTKGYIAMSGTLKIMLYGRSGHASMLECICDHSDCNCDTAVDYCFEVNVILPFKWPW